MANPEAEVGSCFSFSSSTANVSIRRNRDGEIPGWEKTNDAANAGAMQGVLKLSDSIGRKSFIAGAPARWSVQDMSFGLYCKGHTHSPDLAYIEVLHQKGTVTFSGGKIVIIPEHDLQLPDSSSIYAEPRRI